MLLPAVLVAALVVGGLVLALLMAPPRAAADTRPQVVSSFYPYHFVVTSVGGDRVHASVLIPSTVEPHDYEPTPADLAKIEGADAIVFNGHLETWTDRALADLPPGKPVRVNASAGITFNTTDNGEVDPHVWLDPVRMGVIVSTVEAALVQLDPAGASDYHARAAALRANLTTLDASFRSGLSVCSLRTIVVAHEAFAYLSARYNLTMISIQGLSPDTEPSGAKIAELVQIVNQTGVRVVFFEELVDPRVAQTIADEAHVEAKPLSPIEGISAGEAAQGATYLTLMEENLQALRSALGCT